MIFFFGSRANRIRQRRLVNTTCPYCQTQDSFVSTTFGSYAHFFWVPIFPLGKTTVAECSHCKKTYSKDEFSDQMLRSLEKEDEINPSKRPIWHGCGCLIIVGFILFSLISGAIGTIFYGDELDTVDDIRIEQLNADKNRVTTDLSFKKDSISFAVKQCVSMTIEGIATEKIKYTSRIKGNKLMLILKVSDIKQIEKSSRKALVYTVEECLKMLDYQLITEHYIAVDGNWNMLLVKTPNGSDLGGKYADEDLLLSFYNEEDEDVLLNTNALQEDNSDEEELEIESVTEGK